MLGIAGLSLNYLLSLPAIAYFLLPSTTTGWSTYLNLIFFSLAWTTLVWTQSPLAVEFFSILGVRVVFYVLLSLVFLGFDLSIPTVAKTLKARDGALPIEAAGGRAGARSQYERILRIVGLALFNIVLATTLQTGIDFVLTDVLRFRSVLKVSSRLPVPWSLLTDLAKGLIIRGVLSYYIHRFLLHSNEYSPRLSKAHIAYAHSLNNALPFAAAYDHPAAYLLHRWIPVYLPALLLRYHIFTYMALNTLVSLEEAFVFSGYQVLPSTVLLTGMARRQELHLMCGGSGNFALYGAMDFLHSTTLGNDDIVDDLRREGNKRNARGKARGAADATREAIDDVRNGDEQGNRDDSNDAAGRRSRKSRK